MTETPSEVSSEAVEAAARTRYERFATTALAYVPWERRSEKVKEGFREEAREDLTAALPYLAAHQPARVAPRAEEVRWKATVVLTNATNYPATIAPHVPGRDMGLLIKQVTDAVLALYASQPTVAEVREQVASEIEAAGRKDVQWLADHRQDRLDSARIVGAQDAWKSAARVARTETKGGE